MIFTKHVEHVAVCMGLNCTILVDTDIDILSFISELLFFYNFAGYTLKKELQLPFIKCLSFFSLFSPFLPGFYRWSPGMQTGKMPYSIASHNVHRKIAIVIDGNVHVYVQMYVQVCMCICLCVLYVNV